MNFDFFIEKVSFKFEIHGDCEIKIYLNDFLIDGTDIIGPQLKDKNKIEVLFSKKNPADPTSYAILQQFNINDEDFSDSFKKIPYKIDATKHPNTNTEFSNNLYFGYIGKLQFNLEHDNSSLSQASWTLAKNEFEEVKWPLGADNFRQKNFKNILRDAQGMLIGMAQAPKTQAIEDTLKNMDLYELSRPVDLSSFRTNLEQWINQSKRIKLTGLGGFDEFTLSSQGISDSIQSFINSSDIIFRTRKDFWWNGQLLQDNNCQSYFFNEDEIVANGNVLLEYPSPWYTDDEIRKFITVAKQENCRIAIDLTWLPMANSVSPLDLSEVDEVYFSMNKAWPLIDFRPAMRWSRYKINDAQTFNTDHCVYPKIPYQIFLKLMNKFGIDWTFEHYNKDADDLCSFFNLKKTNILWFTRKGTTETKSIGAYISPHYNLDDFVCIAPLLHHKGKYFW